MFQDVTLATLSLPSTQGNETVDGWVQTLAIDSVEGQAQTEDTTTSSATQTNSLTGQGGKKKSVENKKTTTTTMTAQLEACVAHVGALMLQELAQTCRQSSWFTGFERYLHATQDQDKATKLYELSFDVAAYLEPATTTTTTTTTTSLARSSLSCTGVSWNATGSILAVAYGRFDHSGWCTYRSALCLWHVFHPEFNPQKPSLVLETSSGLMCVAFHPQNPSLVAAGSFHGQVFVWDLEPVESRFLSSTIGDYCHCDPVTKVTWVYDIQTAEYNIASVSGDGKVLFWRLKDKLAFPIEGYVLQLPGESSVIIGGKALAVSSVDKASRAFVVGSESGLVARCFAKATSTRLKASDLKGEKKWTATAARLVSHLSASKLAIARRQVEAYASAKRTKDVTLATVYEARLDPATLFPSAMDFVFEAHHAPVYHLSFSPFRKNLFLTASADGTTRLYSTFQREALVSFEVASFAAYLYAVEWSRTRPTVFAVASEDGNVYVFDLKADRVNPVVILGGTDPKRVATTPGGIKPPPMFALDFNPRQRNFVAAGDAAGIVHVWKLSWQLANFQTGDDDVLKALERTSS